MHNSTGSNNNNITNINKQVLRSKITKKKEGKMLDQQRQRHQQQQYHHKNT